MNLHRMVFGRLTVDDDREVVSNDTVRCTCECGNVVQKNVSNLKGGRIRSCGCLRNSWQAHTKAYKGAFKHPLYALWRAMHSRCYNPKDIGFRFYGAKGIKVVESWWAFSAFASDMSGRPPGTTLDRVNSLEDYSKDNCRWAGAAEQGANKVSSYWVYYKGEFVPLAQLSEILGLNHSLLLKRIKRLESGAKPDKRTNDPELIEILKTARKLGSAQ